MEVRWSGLPGACGPCPLRHLCLTPGGMALSFGSTAKVLMEEGLEEE